MVATIRSVAYKTLLPVGDLRPARWEVPGWFGGPFWLNRWTEDDLNRTAATVPAKCSRGRRQYGLSAYLGGGPLVRHWLHAGETTDPLGYALVRVAVDWRRVGVSSPIPQPVLVALAPVYIATARLQVDEEAVRQGLEWATKKINDAVALLDGIGGW